MSEPGPLATPLPALEPYPERAEAADGWLDRLEAGLASTPMQLLARLRRARCDAIARAVAAHGEQLDRLDAAGLLDAARRLREPLRRRGLQDGALVAAAFALVRAAAAHCVGLRHHDVQLRGGLALLRGQVAEMETGEGKTLTATLAAATAALAGIPVHVVTVNDYLAARDADAMGPIYRSLGLSVATVVHGLAPERRRAAYASDIVYASNKEIAFDYLRDRIALGGRARNLRLKLDRLQRRDGDGPQVVMRGLHFAIVDEADSVLIDEARTPLIISRETEPAAEQEWAQQAFALAADLEPGVDFELRRDEQRVELSAAGRERLAAAGERLGGVWHSRVRREQAARMALAARHLFTADEHYLVRDGAIRIIDEYTGRIMADRSWGEGLHQLIEFKEDCAVTGRKVPLARMTYQRFFRRYRRLAGMTGTALEAARELWSVYRLPVVRIPTHRPLRRRHLGQRVRPALDDKWDMVVARAAELAAAGRPLLIGTRSVAASESLSARLEAAGLAHVVLSAAQDRDEAEIVARAGEPGRITVATNMAGRGVDIRLPENVAARGGLHVILTERHDAGRIDRQLEGRCGRQGDPGTTEAILSLQDPLLEPLAGSPLLWLAGTAGPLGRPCARWLFRRAQRRAERTHARARRELMHLDRRMGTLLSFSGRRE